MKLDILSKITFTRDTGEVVTLDNLLAELVADDVDRGCELLANAKDIFDNPDEWEIDFPKETREAGAKIEKSDLNFNKALLYSVKPSKTDPSKSYIDFYVQVASGARAVPIKLAFFDVPTMKYLLANSDKVKAYVKKAVLVTKDEE
jgi:hypothetical protein